MNEAEWETWEEWLADQQTQRFLHSLKARSKFLKSRWAESLWGQDKPDPDSGNLPDYRAQSQVYDQLSGLNRDMLTELMNYEPE